MDIQELQKLILDFRDARDWEQFHNPKDLAASIAVEASELQEKFLRKSVDESFKIGQWDSEVADELADIINNALLFADACKIDIAQACMNKIDQNNNKYPIEKSKWKCTKYHKL